MASGTPDYFQTVREVYGTASVAGYSKTATANAERQLVLVTGKGVIYGGALILSSANSQKNSFPILRIDGVKISWTSFYSMNFYNYYVKGCYPFYLLVYDEKNFNYSVGISGGLTFESSFEIAYDEKHGDTPTVLARPVYAII